MVKITITIEHQGESGLRFSLNSDNSQDVAENNMALFFKQKIYEAQLLYKALVEIESAKSKEALESIQEADTAQVIVDGSELEAEVVR